ncbi:MAG: class I SAM-dependent methyltransferase [Bacteroidia bacterium]|nr:class I SAM-dependent methyltransferase [Bacteroidia bacterium]
MLRYEGRYERLFGIKTMQIKKSDDTHNFHYQGASYLVLSELFKKLPEYLKNKNFIDIGSGKGRPLFCAEHAGFNNLIGVELDKELVDIANENVKLYLLKRKESNFKFVCENATTYSIPENSAVFFFFNPFSDKVMELVEKNITAYQAKTNSEIFVIYVNPQFKNVWIKAGYDMYHTEGNRRYTEALIFRRKAD